MANDKGEAEVILIDDEDVAQVPGLPEVGEDGKSKDGKEIDWKAEAQKYQGMAERRGTKLSKIKSTPKPAEKKAEESQAPKPGELDYGQKAFLIASGIKGDKETALIQEALKSGTFKDLDSVLASKFVQGQLKELRDEEAAIAATPGKNDRSGSHTRDTVDYWLAKGELPPNTPENKKLREDVVNAKLKAKTTTNVFSPNSIVE